MIRKQIYITDLEQKKLSKMSHQTKKTQSELVREAIDQLILHYFNQKQDKLTVLQMARGMWKDRNDLPDFSVLRKELDQRIGSND